MLTNYVIWGQDIPFYAYFLYEEWGGGDVLYSWSYYDLIHVNNLELFGTW